VHHSGGNDFEACRFESAINLADQVLFYAIRLDDGERLLNCHAVLPRGSMDSYD